MALTILSAPGNSSSVNNEMLFVIQEATKANDQVTYPDYTYVCDVYIDSEFVARIKSRPDPTNKMGVFDVSTILRSYVSYGLKANYANYTEEYDATVAYRLKFGEEYDFVLYPDLTVDGSDRTAFKSYKERPFINTEVVDSDVILSNCPQSTRKTLYSYASTRWLPISVYNTAYSGGVHGHVVTFYDSGNNPIATLNKTPAATNGKFLQMNIGAAGFVSRGDISQVILDQTSYYILTWDAEILRVTLVCNSKFTPVNLVWLNPFGVYDSQSFGLVSMKRTELSRKDFSKLSYQMNASGVMSYHENGVFYGSKKGYAATSKVTEKLTSHLLNDDEYTWLAEMFASPDVYRYDAVNELFMPVTITENNYDYRNYRNSRLKPLEFNIEYTDKFNSQLL